MIVVEWCGVVEPNGVIEPQSPAALLSQKEGAHEMSDRALNFWRFFTAGRIK
jgi:hypothetical protein